MKLRHQLAWTSSILFGLLAFLYGCSTTRIGTLSTPQSTSSTEQMDKSPLTGVPCAAPCWQGLEIGKSNGDEVLATVDTLLFINHQSVETTQVSMPGIDGEYGSGILIRASCANSDQQCLSLAVVDNVLTNITVGINYDVKPDEAIAYLGNPDYIGYDNLGAEKVLCEVYMVWRDRRLILAARFNDASGATNYCDVVRDKDKIPAGLLLSQARYMSEVELEAKLGTGTGKFFEFTGTIPDK